MSVSLITNYKLDSAYDVPSFCLSVAEQFEQEPLFKGNLPKSLCGRKEVVYHLEGGMDCKVIKFSPFIDSIYLVRLIEHFSENATILIGSDASSDYWNMHIIEDWNNGNAKFMLVRIYPKAIQSRTLESLRENYIQIFKKITSNWVQAKVEDHPRIYTKMDQNEKKREFLLFTKKKELSCNHEVGMINFIADHLNFDISIFCISDLYKHINTHPDHPEKPPYNADPYMWIDEEKAETFIGKMGFQIKTTKLIAAHIFLTIVLLCDGYLQKKNEIDEAEDEDKQEKTLHFFRITERLPQDVQMIIANRLVGKATNRIPVEHVETALKQMLMEGSIS